jgi:5-methylcytosine-specific restriction enzyme subunit McrC
MTTGGETGFTETLYYTEYGIPIRNLWHMLLYAWNEPPFSLPENLKDVEDAPSLDSLLASVLVKLVQQRIRIGLGRSYTDEQQFLRGVRGRIKFAESLKSLAFERGQAYCQFQQYSLNVPKNQIVRSTLMRLVQVGQFGPEPARAELLRHTLRRLVRELDGVDLVELQLDFIRRQQLGRNDRDYRLMLVICELLLQRQMPTDSYGSHTLPALKRAELVMHRIYERFVANFYQIHLKDWQVIPQKYIVWHTQTPSSYLPGMQPDLVMQHKTTRRIVVLDTKFTTQSIVKNQWGGAGFNSPHLYQIYAYLKTQEHLSEQHRQATGILLYPQTSSEKVSERIGLQEQTIRIESIDLTTPWQEIEQVLLETILLQ